MNRLLRLGSLALLACGILLGSLTLNAQTIERRISYQGLLTQPNGRPITDGPYTLVLRFYDAPTGGNLVFEEQQNINTQGGLFNVLIGSNTPLTGVDFNQQLWLETLISGQSAFTPRTRLGVVPYAIIAENALVADSISQDFDGFVRSLNGAQGDLAIKGEDGITVTRDGDTIRISGTIGGGSIETITSQDGTIDVTNPNGPVTDVSLADGAVTEEKIGDGAVTNPKLGDRSVGTTKLEDASVTAEKIAPGVIPTTLPPSGPAGGDLTGTYPDPLIRQDAVTTDKIADGNVRTADIADGNVVESKIGDGAVSTQKIQIGAVTNDRIADNAVSTSKILDENVTSAKLSKTGVTPGIYGSDLLIPRVQVDDRGRITQITQVSIPDIPFTGPAGGDLTGTFPNPTIRPGAVTNTKIADGAVGSSKIQGNAITTDKIANGTILAEDLAPGVIPTTLPPSGPAGGVLAGTYPNPSINQTQGTQLLNALNNPATSGTLNDNRLNTTGVTAATYGSVTQIPIITVDQYGRLTNVGIATLGPTTPTGAAGGDLQGNYPNPLINPTAAAGNRMVDAIRADYLNGDPDINTANNIVVLDGNGRLPAVDGSRLTNLSASNITEGVLPIERGGTNSSTSLNNNRIMISSGGKIVESAPVPAQTFLIGTGTATLPTPGTITAGPGIDISFSAPNFVISNTNAKLLPGTANDQTLRWDAIFNQWVPNANVLGSASGNLTANGNLLVMGTGEIKGSTDIGSTDDAINRMGDADNTTNSIGSSTADNYIYGNTYINVNTAGFTQIGNISSPNSSTTISVGSNGNLQLNGIDADNPERFLALDINNNVRSASAAGLAKEGIQWQNYAFRLGSENTTINPLESSRFVNLNNHTLSWTRLNGTETMMQFNGGANRIDVSAPTNINTTTAYTTTIGNPASLTTIGGQLDPRGNITNNVGNVVILDETEIIGPTFINVGNSANTTIGNISNTGDQSISLSVGTGANGYLYAHNIKEDPTPLYMMTEDGFERVRKKLLADMADEGIQYQNGAFRLGTGQSTPNYLREKSYDENRFVNLDEFNINFTNGSEGADGVTFVQFDGDQGGNTLVTITSRTDINTLGSGNTNIGNSGSVTTVLGPTFVNATGGDATQIGNGIGANGNVGIGEPALGSHLLTINGTPQTNASVNPNIRIDHLGGQAFNAAPYVDDADNGVITGDVDGQLYKWDENIFLNPFAWRVIGNDHPITDGVNNLLGTLDAENVRMITDGNNALVISGADQTIGIGADPTGAAQVEITAATANNGLYIDAFSNGGVNGIEIDAPGAGILLNANGTPGVVGVSMDGTTTGLLIENATTSMDVEGTAYINDNYNADVFINTDGSTGNTQIGGPQGIPPQTRLVVDNIIDVRGSSYNINGRPAYRVSGNNFLWEGAGGNNNTLVGNTTNTALSGSDNVAVGYRALQSMAVGVQNVAIGSNAADGTNNAAQVTAIGYLAGRTAASRSTYVGAYSGRTSTGGEQAYFGMYSGENASGGANTLIGVRAGRDAAGANNTILGHNAGLTVNSGNVIIGKSVAETNFAGASNRLLIDNSDTPTPLIAGDFAADQLTFNVGTVAASLLVPGTAQTNASVNPNVRIGHLGGAAFDNAPYVDDANNGLITSDANGDLYKWDEETVIGAFAWLLGGNTAPSSNVLGTLDGTDIDVQTNGTTALTVSGTDQQVTVSDNGAISLQVDGVGGTSNIRATSLSSNGAAYNPATDGIVVADNNGDLRRTPLPGELIFGRKTAAESRAAGPIAADAQMVATTGSGGEFEIEVYIMYSGDTFPASALDFSLVSAGATSISYGVVSSGQAVSPSNVDGSGSVISGIGTSIPPTNRQTILVKGYIDLPAAGSVTLHWGDSVVSGVEQITIHQNSYIKLTRNQ